MILDWLLRPVTLIFIIVGALTAAAIGGIAQSTVPPMLLIMLGISAGFAVSGSV